MNLQALHPETGEEIRDPEMESAKASLSSSWQIGSVRIPNRTVLAPMAGVTDLAFRALCKEQGAGLICMEMVSAKAVSYHNRNTESLLRIADGEHPISLQLFGKEPDLMGEVAKMLESRPFDILDVNMGCPVPKVVNNGEGSALLKNPPLIGAIIASLVKSTVKPVTAKIRVGFEGADVDIVDIARRIEDAGAAAITVHGRTRQQYYSGKADWEAIRRVKEAVSIPVIGNGDVTDGIRAEAMLKETGCDAVMIGRACRGNPWIFHQINEYLESGTVLPRPSWEEIREEILRHARLQIEREGECTAMRQMRKHVAWYTAGMHGGAALRCASNTLETYAQLEEML